MSQLTKPAVLIGTSSSTALGPISDFWTSWWASLYTYLWSEVWGYVSKSEWIIRSDTNRANRLDDHPRCITNNS